MMQKIGLLVITVILYCFCSAQDSSEQKGFKKENLFTGGSVSLSFGEGSFLAGVNPVIGYSIAKWVDVGIVINYTYTSYRDYNVFDDKLRQSVYGGGVFTRLFPLRFLFLQGQAEHNFIQLKYLPPGNGTKEVQKQQASSFLVGGGYATGRSPYSGNTYGYLAILFDIGDDQYSPYKDGANRSVPIIRAGVNVPLFQGKRNNNNSSSR